MQAPRGGADKTEGKRYNRGGNGDKQYLTEMPGNVARPLPRSEFGGIVKEINNFMQAADKI